MYLALFASAVGLPNAIDTELSGNGYSRQPINLDAIGLNDSVVVFSPATADWGKVEFAALMDTLTAGTVENNANGIALYGPLSTPLFISAGQSVRVPTGQLISLANAETAPAAGEDGVAIDITQNGWTLFAGEYVYSLIHNLESTDLLIKLRDDGNAEISVNHINYSTTNRIELRVPVEPDCRFAGRAMIERA